MAWQPTSTAISPLEIECARAWIRVGLRQERPRASIRRSDGAATPGTEPSMSAVQSHKSRIRQSWPAKSTQLHLKMTSSRLGREATPPS